MNRKICLWLFPFESLWLLCVVPGVHQRLPPWIRSFDLFRHRRIALGSWGVHGLRFVVEDVFRQSGVVPSFEVVDPVLFLFESHVLYSRDLQFFHHHLPPWIRSFDLFRHLRVAILSWGVHGLIFLGVCSWGCVSGVWRCPLSQDGWSSFVCICVSRLVFQRYLVLSWSSWSSSSSTMD